MIPVKSQILFKPFKSEEKTEGGLIVPESVMEISNKGVIVKVGNGTEKKPMKLKEGMTAYRVKNWGEPILENGELYFLMDESAILAVE